MKCSGTNKDGSPCGANVFVEGDTLCFRHNPDTSDRAHEASAKGGKESRRDVSMGKTLPEDARDVVIESVSDVRVLMRVTINQVRKGQIGSEIARTVATLASVILKTWQHDDTERRIGDLEEIVRRFKDTPTAKLLEAAKGAPNGAPLGEH